MPAAARPAAIARVGSRAGRSTSRADRTQATDAPAPCSPAGGSGAVDDPPAPSLPGPRSRPGDLSDDPARASDSLSLRACSGHRKSNRWRILQGVFPQPVNSQNAFAHTLMGVLRRQQSRFDDSLTELRVALAMRPDFPPTLANLGITLAFVGL